MRAEEFAQRPPTEVLNQVPALEGHNLFASDPALQQALVREGGGWAVSRAVAYGELLGRPESLRLGELANRHLPLLRGFDRWGRPIDLVEFHDSWHALMRLGVEHGTHSLAWTADRAGAHVARAALSMLRHQLDEGSSCPLTMTFAVVPSLRLQPELASEWERRILSESYDPRVAPAQTKSGALFGMALTERQGGSDVRSNTTRATPLGRSGPGNEYAITGHKWFCSAPMCDAFLVLAQAPGGLSCFLLPRFRPDGTPNTMHVLRLKDKLGNRSNASSEIELCQAWARLIGEEGRGVANIIEMVRHTRLDCAFGSAATLRRAVTEALHHAEHRWAFGKRLIQQPLMQNVLADLCLESEAATTLSLRLARSFDEAPTDASAQAYSRMATAIGKYWITKRAVTAVAEVLECIGGNGYVEEHPLARLYRDVPLNSIWEGSGNVQCLDVLRSSRKQPESLQVIRDELRRAAGAHPLYDAWLRRIDDELSHSLEEVEFRGRRIVEALALGLQAALLLQHAPTPVADTFCVARLSPEAGRSFGTLPADAPFRQILDRAFSRG